MSHDLMVLPAEHFEHIRVVRIPKDMEEHEAFRYATGVIAGVQEDMPDCSWEDIAEALEAHGFEPQEFILGPELACR